MQSLIYFTGLSQGMVGPSTTVSGGALGLEPKSLKSAGQLILTFSRLLIGLQIIYSKI